MSRIAVRALGPKPIVVSYADVQGAARTADSKTAKYHNSETPRVALSNGKVSDHSKGAKLDPGWNEILPPLLILACTEHGGPDLEDQPMFDPTDRRQWLLVVVTQQGNRIVIYRRLYFGGYR